MNQEQVAAYVKVALDNLHQQLTSEFQETIKRKDNEIQILLKKDTSRIRKGKERVKEPEEYKGDRKKTAIFIHQCKLVFEAQSDTYDKDDSKIRYAGSFCRGAAANWFQNAKERKLFEEVQFEEFR